MTHPNPENASGRMIQVLGDDAWKVELSIDLYAILVAVLYRMEQEETFAYERAVAYAKENDDTFNVTVERNNNTPLLWQRARKNGYQGTIVWYERVDVMMDGFLFPRTGVLNLGFQVGEERRMRVSRGPWSTSPEGRALRWREQLAWRHAERKLTEVEIIEQNPRKWVEE